ncbi:MAG: DNA cytosine methyltransferase [Hellea sp.]
MQKPMRVIDFFCGAGGFSEGFRQQGFSIVMGIDYWQPAVNSHNLNHNLNDTVKDVLDFWGTDSGDVEEIEKLEDVEILIGSPSCVSFSMSNRAGKADKTDGIRLVESYLRVIAVKKNKKDPSLKAWYMENVPKSRDFIREKYTFSELNLSNWATSTGYKPSDLALEVKGEILNAGDFGAPQGRKRFIAGEWVETGAFIAPVKTRDKHKTVADIKNHMPKINAPQDTRSEFKDPNYPNIVLTAQELTDHFYDTGVHQIKWEKAEFLKTNHPFMGRMSFPENEDRTSRTILATRSASTREAILYKSEYDRKGDGEYRLPTIREAASLMGFPFVYQFFGSEGTKWRQIGNSVCPHLSAALAKSVRKKNELKPILDGNLDFLPLKENYKKVHNLNTFQETELSPPKKRPDNARFRRHAFKRGNMTVDLMNYHPDDSGHIARKWYVTSFFGTGTGYKKKVFTEDELGQIEDLLEAELSEYKEFKAQVNLAGATVKPSSMQNIYENDLSLEENGNPILILKNLEKLIFQFDGTVINKAVNCNLLPKNNIPIAHLMSAYGLLTLLK